MKILISANNYPTPKYPLQAFIGVLCRELTRQGHEVSVISAQLVLSVIRHHIGMMPSYFEDEVQTDQGVKVIKVYRPKVIAPGSGGKLGNLSRWLVRKTIEHTVEKIDENFDVVYCHFWLYATYMMKYVKKHDLPLFVATGEDTIKTEILGGKTFMNLLYKEIKGVICVSTKNKEESIAKHLTSEDKCIVLPNAIESDIFHKMNKMTLRKELGFPDDAFIVAFCGRFNQRKGAFRLAKAIQMCNDSNLRAIFIGLPMEGQTKLPECDGILYRGALPHEDVAKYLNAADVYVLPSLAEGCSNSIIEAMACGLPIISSDLPFNYDVLNEENAILIDPMNVEEIASAITKIKENKDLHKRMSDASLQKASELTIENRVKKILEFINQRNETRNK